MIFFDGSCTGLEFPYMLTLDPHRDQDLFKHGVIVWNRGLHDYSPPVRDWLTRTMGEEGEKWGVHRSNNKYAVKICFASQADAALFKLTFA